MQSSAKALQEARDLHRKGVDAACKSRSQESLTFLRRGLALLDSIHPVESASHDEWLLTRIRLTCTLAFVEAETTSGAANGLARLAELRALLPAVRSPLLRTELSGAVEHNYGSLLFAAGRFEDGISYYDISVRHQERLLLKTAEPARLIDPLLKTLAGRGLAYTRLANVRRAREDLTRGVALAEQYDLRASAANVRRLLGTLELRTGNVPGALDCYNQSERIYTDLGQDVPDMLRLDQAEALLVAGLADEAGERLDDVLPGIQKQQSTRDLATAELFRAQAALMSDDLGIAWRLADSAHRRMRRWGCETCTANAAILSLRADAEQALQSGDIPLALSARALRFARGLPTPRLADQAAIARMLAVRLHVRLGKLKRARDILAEVPRLGSLTPIDQRMLRRLCRAELAAAEGDTSRALREIRSGLSELDKVRDRMGGLELVSGTAVHGQELSELAIRLVMDSRPRRLFEWLERTRAQTYRYEPLGAEDPELADRIAEVRSLTQSVHQAQHDGHPTTALRSRLNERLREAHQLGWHTGRWGKPRPVAGLTEVGERLEERALVSFASSEDSLVAVVVLDGDVRMVRLGSFSVAAERARMLNVDINALAPDHLPAPLVSAVSASAHKQAALLDEQLIHPIIDLIGDRDLVVVPTGALYAVPWGVLPSLHCRPTVVAPSATAWLAAEQVEARGGRTVLVRGPGLPAAVGEIDKLAAHHRTAKLLSGSEATVAAVLKALDGAKLAHIAAHGAHEPENALFSRLEVGDGSLFAHEMASLTHPPRHVVLAACELALNRIRPGDEALGFASALLASGSQTVIAPISKVGDQASAAAMDDYHRLLATGARPAVALADAIAVDPLRRPFVCLGSGHAAMRRRT
jgi:tetratricopeptide (TPR) repeat protein